MPWLCRTTHRFGQAGIMIDAQQKIRVGQHKSPHLKPVGHVQSGGITAAFIQYEMDAEIGRARGNEPGWQTSQITEQLPQAYIIACIKRHQARKTAGAHQAYTLSNGFNEHAGTISQALGTPGLATCRYKGMTHTRPFPPVLATIGNRAAPRCASACNSTNPGVPTAIKKSVACMAHGLARLDTLGIAAPTNVIGIRSGV